MKLRILCGLWLLFLAGWVTADEIQLNPSHPDRYIVVKGDTLWDIAAKFLTNPWQWREIWHDNPQIEDPHWIYPGDELVLTMVNGKPYLQVEHRTAQIPHRPDEARLSPTVRSEPLGAAIPTIPFHAIQPFLTQPKVILDPRVMERAPYVVGMVGEHITVGAGDQVFIRGTIDPKTVNYRMFRPGAPYEDGETGEVLGHEALYVGDVETVKLGDPAIFNMTSSEREVVIGDRILPVQADKLHMYFHPHPPVTPVRGRIISVVDGVSQIGQWNIVIIDRGTMNGLDVGSVLEIRQGSNIIRDIVSPWSNDYVTAPPIKLGLLMVFHPFERVSFALVLGASDAINISDLVFSP